MTDLVETDHRDDILDLRATTNQVPALVGHNVVTSDLALTEAVTRLGSTAVVDGLAARAVLRTLEQAELACEVAGTGRVASQTPRAGQVVPRGSTVRVTLAPPG